MAVYLQAALLCERILLEQDRVLSAIRIIDKITAVTEPSPEAPVFRPLSILVAVKFGEGPRPSRIAVELESPAGERILLVDAPAGLPGESGANIYGQIPLVFPALGSYWFRVLADAVELTRMLLTVELARPPGPPAVGGETR